MFTIFTVEHSRYREIQKDGQYFLGISVDQVGEQRLQEIVQALNAWEEITRAYEIAQRSGDQIGKAGAVYLTVHALMSKDGVIPKIVDSAEDEHAD